MNLDIHLKNFFWDPPIRSAFIVEWVCQQLGKKILEMIVIKKKKLYHQVFLVAQGMMLLEAAWIENFELKSDWEELLSECEEVLEILPLSYCVWKLFSCVWLFATPWTVTPRLLCPWNSPGKNTGVGCHFLLQGIFPTWGWNLGLLLCRQILYCPSHITVLIFYLLVMYSSVRWKKICSKEVNNLILHDKPLYCN